MSRIVVNGVAGRHRGPDEHTGEVEEERSPNLGGRPPVGPTISTRLPAELLEQVDANARAHGQSRAEAIRRLLAAALAATAATT